MLYSLYTMVSIPEAKTENAFESPVILGVFDSKEAAKNAWKKRGAEFKDIKSKTVHTYSETFSTGRDSLPQFIYMWATYTVYAFSEFDDPEFNFTPYASGYFETQDEYLEKKKWVKEQNPTPWKEVCEKSDFKFYASNEDISEKVEINRLVRIPVALTEKNL